MQSENALQEADCPECDAPCRGVALERMAYFGAGGLEDAALEALSEHTWALLPQIALREIESASSMLAVSAS